CRGAESNPEPGVHRRHPRRVGLGLTDRHARQRLAAGAGRVPRPHGAGAGPEEPPRRAGPAARARLHLRLPRLAGSGARSLRGDARLASGADLVTCMLPPMATAKAEETRNRILDAALRLFRERGFEQTTMRDVATAAGVATGAAYYYYRSKEDLVMAFYLRADEEARDSFARAITASKDLKKRLRGIIDAKFAQFEEHRSLLTALLKAGVDPRERLSPFSTETREVREDSIA